MTDCKKPVTHEIDHGELRLEFTPCLTVGRFRMGLVPCPTPYTQQVRNSGKVRANIKGKRMDKVPVTIRVSYDLLKQLLDLPDDVNVLGIVGVNDEGGSFPLILETPARHIKTDNLTCRYNQVDGKASFAGFC